MITGTTRGRRGSTPWRAWRGVCGLRARIGRNAEMRLVDTGADSSATILLKQKGRLTAALYGISFAGQAAALTADRFFVPR